MAKALKCPACKKAGLEKFDESPSSVTMTCPACSKVVVAKTKFGKVVEVVVPGVTVVAGAAAVLDYLGIYDLEDLLEAL